MPKAMRSLFVTVVVVLVLVAAYLTPGAAQQAPRVSPDLYSQLRWRYIGPVGNRISRSPACPAIRRCTTRAAASGGIFKTADGGVHWDAIFDDQPVSSIGVARGRAVRSERRLGRHRRGVHPQQHLDRRRHLQVDRRRQDVDAAWASKRPAASAASSSIRAIRDVVFACALGHAYGPQPERGVFRTADGGKTWQRTLFVDENTGCSDIAMDAEQPAHPVRRHVADRNPHVGPRPAAGRAAACSSRATAA